MQWQDDVLSVLPQLFLIHSLLFCLLLSTMLICFKVSLLSGANELRTHHFVCEAGKVFHLCAILDLSALNFICHLTGQSVRLVKFFFLLWTTSSHQHVLPLTAYLQYFWVIYGSDIVQTDVGLVGIFLGWNNWPLSLPLSLNNNISVSAPSFFFFFFFSIDKISL